MAGRKTIVICLAFLAFLLIAIICFFTLSDNIRPNTITKENNGIEGVSAAKEDVVDEALAFLYNDYDFSNCYINGKKYTDLYSEIKELQYIDAGHISDNQWVIYLNKSKDTRELDTGLDVYWDANNKRITRLVYNACEITQGYDTVDGSVS